MFIPKGTPHGRPAWKNFRFPHVRMSLMLGAGNPPVERKPQKGQARETGFDYEQYVVRSPIREAGRGYYKSGRQSPTMTYLSESQINIANHYLEFGWIWDIVEPNIGEMVHNKVDEIVLHMGGDPQDPEDLGADLEIRDWRRAVHGQPEQCLLSSQGFTARPSDVEKGQKTAYRNGDNARRRFSESGLGRCLPR